jgi:Protein of unknown function (DUF1552)
VRTQKGIVRHIPRQLSRRMLLRGAFGASVALPFLDAMMPKSSFAQATAVPKRFGVFFSACGTEVEFWTPTGLNPSTANPTKTNPAISTQFTLSPILMPLAPHQQNIVVLRGVSMEATQGKYGPIANVHDQGMTIGLTAIPLVKGPSGAGRANHFVDGSAGGPSIDNYIAQKIGAATRLSSLELGVESTDTFLELLVTQMCYGNVNTADTNPNGKRALAVPPVDDPVQIYTRLFGTTQTGSVAQMTAALKNRQSVLDYAISDYNTLKLKLGADDQSKLDQHLTFIRQIENGLTTLINNPTNTSCPGATKITPVSPARQQCLRDQDLRTAAELAMQAPNFCVTNFPLIGQMQMDLMVLAYSCDITRVASMQWSTAESTAIHTWLPQFGLPPLAYTGTKEHHFMTHNETIAVSALTPVMGNAGTVSVIRSDISKIDTWYAMQFAYLLNSLKGISQPNGTTLLDNTLLFWTTEVGVGGVHSYTNIPYVVAGGPGVGLTTGRFIDFLGPTAYPAAFPNGSVAVPFGVGPAHNKMFVSFLNKMGIMENAFGMTGAATGEMATFTGPLPGL